MRKVNKNYRQKPSSLQSHRVPYINAVQAVIDHPGWFATASGLYKSPPVLRALNTIYNYKCAFCEHRPIGSPAQVEHFRPKQGVSGIAHTGYYWLAYEWSNLLLACGNCNSTKGNHFPIANNGSRVTIPILVGASVNEATNFILNNPLNQEGFILLNPEIDKPSQHLVYLPSGRITHLTPRGDESIVRYDLNRDELVINGRKAIIDRIMRKFATRLDRYISGARTSTIVVQDLVDIIIEDIVEPITYNRSFSTFCKQMLLQFDQFFIGAVGNPRAAHILRFSFLRVINSIQ